VNYPSSQILLIFSARLIDDQDSYIMFSSSDTLKFAILTIIVRFIKEVKCQF